MSPESGPKSEERIKKNPFNDPKIAEEWARSVEGEEGLWRDEILYPAMQSWLESFSDGKSVILDIGSGQGRSSSELEGYGRYIGVEPSEFLAKRAQELYPSENRDFVVGDAYELPIDKDSVDGVLSVNVLFHLEDLDKAVEQMSKVLKNGGSFFINTADNDSLGAWKRAYVNPNIDSEKMVGEVIVPVNNLSLNTFYFQPNEKVIEILKKHGLEVEKVTKSLEVEGGETMFVTFEGKKVGVRSLEK